MPTISEGPRQADRVVLTVLDSKTVIDRFQSYSFDSNFLEPTDAWHLVTGGKELSQQVEDALIPGATVQLSVNEEPQATGYIDTVVKHGDRGSGRIIEITGCDTFAPVVRGGVDPYNKKLHFTANNTLSDLIVAIFETFGFTSFQIDDAADRAVKTGLRAQRFSKKKGKPLKSFTFPQQLKPTPGETAWNYVSRIAERMGLYIWPSADGTTVIVSTPDYIQPPIAKLTRTVVSAGSTFATSKVSYSANNIISGGVGCHTGHQPSCIVATGFSGGGEWARSHLKVMMVNELVGLAELTSAYNQWIKLAPEIYNIIENNLDSIIVAIRDGVFPDSLARPTKHAVPIFLHDEDSKDIQQLANFVRRKMSTYQKEMWVGEYEVSDHTYFDGQQYIPWTVNTIVEVNDEISGFYNPMWVCGRTFMKDAKTGGTKTRLHLTLPHTIEFFDYPPQAVTAAKQITPGSTDKLNPTIEWVTITVDGDGRGSVLLNNQYPDQ